jgi:hypothetical protein
MAWTPEQNQDARPQDRPQENPGQRPGFLGVKPASRGLFIIFLGYFSST